LLLETAMFTKLESL